MQNVSVQKRRKIDDKATRACYVGVKFNPLGVEIMASSARTLTSEAYTHLEKVIDYCFWNLCGPIVLFRGDGHLGINRVGA